MLPKLSAYMKRTRAKEEPKDPVAVAVGVLIREGRLRARLTQREVARRASYDSVSVSRVETGDVLPGLETALRLAAAIGMRPDFSPVMPLVAARVKSPHAAISMLPTTGADEGEQLGRSLGALQESLEQTLLEVTELRERISKLENALVVAPGKSRKGA